ncbi:Oxygen-dependent choline dehydrogenase [Madurella mycetomatis]|uniref:Oxygen-dependent choline dehydrogenase n=1 Tax=Madurella mycetomatis TaxID=100816 RepID=A0A175W912_9PEZI|nr:Oxygen-dependent choline dehydrogenase [Madurella mycetomatis]KXX80012.1 Oxygen-dependent choline dehydrogenase [Madurella mycetomatis]
MFLGRLLGFGALCATVLAQPANQLTDYEYIVVGSGAGGGPLAARLALAGHKTLLIEAGDDQGANINYTVPSYHARVSEDERLSWNFFVRHYADDARQARDWKTSYQTPDGSIYSGLNPPPGSRMMGVLYPRTGTLGGCTAHNAMVTVYPHQSDFEYMATMTGDSSWSPSNMRKYFARLERKQYLPGLPKGHGKDGWLATELTPLTVPLKDPQLLAVITGGAWALGDVTNQILNIGTLLAGDLNEDSERRDDHPNYYQIPISTNDGARNGAREFIVAVRDAKNQDGSKKYPLDVRLNCHVTRVLFDETVSPPRAIGVEFLDGAHLYRASPLSPEYEGKASAGAGGGTAQSPRGTPGSALASREVIVAGGAYNSPQILKLSGVGPADELRRFGIRVVADLPGVGSNLQDHYETVVTAKVPNDWPALAGCTFQFNGTDDPCLDKWQNPGLLGDRGTYVSAGLSVAMLYKSSASADGSFDSFVFGGPANFAGYYPGYSYDAVAEHDWWSWVVLKAHPRNTAGTVRLRSGDPLDTPEIVYNYFDTGSGDHGKDLQAMYEAIELARRALRRQPVKTNEVLPGAAANTQAEVEQYIKDGAWGHHASSTCPIGPDGDPMAVLDSKFRVRKVQGLRVVDASVFPRIPGTFTAVSTYMVAEKAAEDILNDL